MRRCFFLFVEMWTANIKFVVNHGGYGNAGDNGVERTDLIEMWGYFMGREYAHRRYGPNRHSALLPFYNATDAAQITFDHSWYAVNENRGGLPDHRFEWDHIPACYLHDLMDDNPYNTSQNPALNETNGVTDNISGYTIGNIYNFLDGSTTSPASLMDKLRNNLPTGNTTENFDLLRASYGY